MEKRLHGMNLTKQNLEVNIEIIKKSATSAFAVRILYRSIATRVICLLSREMLLWGISSSFCKIILFLFFEF